VRSQLISLDLAYDRSVVNARLTEFIGLETALVVDDDHLHRSNIVDGSLLVLVASARNIVLLCAKKRLFHAAGQDLDVKSGRVAAGARRRAPQVDTS